MGCGADEAVFFLTVIREGEVAPFEKFPMRMESSS